jgi:hypothetical protein
MMEITKWNETFENADTRKRQRLGWLFTPTGCDSNGYLSLVAKDGGFEAFGIFMAICQWSATQPKNLRGKLVRSNGDPLTEKDIAVRIRAESCQVSAALKLLICSDVGWISEDDSEKSAGNLPVICQSSPAFVQGEGEGQGQGQGEGEDKRTPAEWVPNSLQMCLNSIFLRRKATKWSKKEVDAFRFARVDQEDLDLVTAFYAAPETDETKFRRTSLLTLLNNWTGEVDKARRFAKGSDKRRDDDQLAF